MRRPTRIPKLDDAGEPGSPRRNVDYAAIGAANGPQAVGWEALRRGAQSLMNQGLQDQAQQAAKDGAQIGAADGAAAFDQKRGPTLRDDGTVFGQARDNAMMTAYLTRLDLSSDELALKLAQDHKEDPDGFRTRWDKAGQAVIGQLPPEFREPAQMEWARKGLTQLAPITRARADRDLAEANAELVKGMDNYQTQAGNAWRSGDLTRAAEFDQKFRETLKARTDLDPRRREAELLKYEDGMRRHNILGNFDQAKKGGLGAAEGFIKGFADPKTHPQFDPDSRDKLVAEMTRDLSDLRARRAQEVDTLRAAASDALYRAEQGYDSPDLSKMAGRLRLLGDTHFAERLDGNARTAQLKGDLAKMALPDLRRRAEDLDRMAQSSSDAESVRRAVTAKEVLKSKAAALQNDFVAHSRGIGEPVGKVDWNDAASLQARAAAIDVLARKNGLRGAPLLDRDEATDLADRLGQGSAADNAGLLGNLHAGFGQALPSVLDSINEKSPEFAHAGALWSQGRAGQAIAREILFGQEIIKNTGRDGAAGGRQYMPPKDDAFKLSFETHLPAGVTAGMAPSDVEGLRKTVMAAYAAKSHAAGNVQQLTVDDKTMRAAIRDVTGGVLAWNGQSFFAPVPGMTQADLTMLMDDLTDADLMHAQSTGGEKLTPAQIRRWGTLRMVEPGKYAIDFGGKSVTTPFGSSFHLDLAAMARARGLGGK